VDMNYGLHFNGRKDRPHVGGINNTAKYLYRSVRARVSSPGRNAIITLNIFMYSLFSHAQGGACF
jgi:hypothetical protein